MAITQALLQELFHYDPLTGGWFRRAGRNAGERAGRLKPGVKGGKPYWYVRVEGRERTASRLAWLYMTGSWPSSEVDHHDRDSTNDRWDNLRPATRYQNEANKTKYRNNKSGFRGVHFRGGKYEASIQRHWRRKILGRFDTPEAAADAYIAAAAARDGEFLAAA